VAASLWVRSASCFQIRCTDGRPRAHSLLGPLGLVCQPSSLLRESPSTIIQTHPSTPPESIWDLMSFSSAILPASSTHLRTLPLLSVAHLQLLKADREGITEWRATRRGPHPVPGPDLGQRATADLGRGSLRQTMTLQGQGRRRRALMVLPTG
jgi:hypothetical protein